MRYVLNDLYGSDHREKNKTIIVIGFGILFNHREKNKTIIVKTKQRAENSVSSQDAPGNVNFTLMQVNFQSPNIVWRQDVVYLINSYTSLEIHHVVTS